MPAGRALRNHRHAARRILRVRVRPAGRHDGALHFRREMGEPGGACHGAAGRSQRCLLEGHTAGWVLMAFHVFSNAFAEGGTIPRLHSCEGADVSPSLEWRDPPAGTLSFALVMEDPDAPSGLWTHWMLWDIPRGPRTLAQGAERVGVSGMNDFGRPGYGGPCPPRGQTHRYYLRLYAIG